MKKIEALFPLIAILVLVLVLVFLVTEDRAGAVALDAPAPVVSFEAQAVVGCTAITSTPYIITVSGSYCLTGDLTASAGGIVVNTDNVVIDFDGWTLYGSQSSTNTFIGINATNRSNITVMNGEIVGFFYAIRIDDSNYGNDSPYTNGWHTISNMEISRSTFRGIVVRGVSNVVRDNVVSHIQGNTFYANSFAIGIEGTGQGILIEDNFIYEVRGYGTGEGVGISISNAGMSGTVIDNVISNISVEENDGTDWDGLSRSTFGIWVGGSSSVVVSDNVIQNYMFGITFSSPTQRSLIINNSILGSYSPIYADNINHLVADNVCDMDCFDTYEPFAE